MNIRLCLFIIICTFSVSAQSFDKAKLDRYLDSLEVNDKAMLSLAVIEKGKPVYQRSIGFVDVENKKKPNKDSQYRIGSITKVLTATMIFQLIDEGKLSLDTRLSEFFPNVSNAQSISISMLLSHRSGIHNFTSTPEFAQYKTSTKTKADMIRLIEGMESDFAPGSRAKYSNSGYVLLGFIIEEITQDNYASQLQTRIVNKLNLERTVYGGAIDTHRNQAKSYRYSGDEWLPASETDMSIPHGAGAIISSPTEIAIFLYSLFDGKVVSSESLAKMTEINQRFGHGLVKFPFYSREAYGHNGGIDGFSSQAGYFEEDDVAIALVSNGMNYPLNDINIAILSIYFDHPYELPNFDNKAIALSEKELVNFEGVYASQDMPLKITLTIKDAQLTAQATGQRVLNLTPFSKSEFRFEPAGIVMLFEDGEGYIDYSTFKLRQGGGTYKFVRE